MTLTQPPPSTTSALLLSSLSGEVHPIPDSAPGPRDGGRLMGLDIARGLAVLGMAAAHVAATSDDLSTLAGWLGLTHGRSSILFALLAGISFGLMTGARRPYTGLRALQARTRILVRSALLLAVGGALSMLGTPVALILAAYAVWFVLALPFARWPFRRLLMTGLAIGIVGPVAAYYGSDLIQRLGWGTGDGNGVVVQALLGTYPGLMWMGFVLVGLALSRLDLGDRRTLATILAGGLLAAVLGHGISWASGVADDGAEVSSGSVSESMKGEMAYESEQMSDDPGLVSPGAKAVTSDGMIETLPDGTVVNWDQASATLPDGTVLTDVEFEDLMNETFGEAPGLGGPTFDTTMPVPRPDAMLALTPHASTPMEFLGFGGTAAAIVALCLLLPSWARRLALPVAAVGAMSLTAYAAHVVMIYLWPDFFLNHADPSDNLPYAVMVAGLVAFAVAWRFTFGRGPLEALLRTVSMRAARVE